MLIAAGSRCGLAVDVDAQRLAVVDARNGTFSGMLPAVVARELRDADAVRLDLGGGRPIVAVKVSRAENADEQVLRRAGLPQAKQPAIVLSGRLPSAVVTDGPAQPHPLVDASMTVVLRSEKVGEVIVRRFKLMLGESDDVP